MTQDLIAASDGLRKVFVEKSGAGEPMFPSGMQTRDFQQNL